MSGGIIAGLLPAIDSILSIRDAAGAVIEPVFIVTRTWSGQVVGEGESVDVAVQILPSPALKNYKVDFRTREGGEVKSGDVGLGSVSKNKYKRVDLDGTSPAQNIEKLYRIGDTLYQVIGVAESYVTWSVQLRTLTQR